MRLMWAFLMSGLLSGFAWSPAALAQQGEETTEPPATSTSSDDKEKKIPFALYVYASTGSMSTDPLNTSIETDSRSAADSFVTLDDQDYTKAVLGWKLPHGKGEFRLAFSSIREDSYEFDTHGNQAALNGVGEIITERVPWWIADIVDGQLTAAQAEPFWTVADDALGNGNNAVELAEVRYAACPMIQVRTEAEVLSCFAQTLLLPLDDPQGPTLSHVLDVTDDLQNTAIHIDLLYGREFGRRRYSAHWWAGMRYFAYEGNLLAGAWLGVTPPGGGFTDGTNLRLLNFAQDTTGFGPTGIMEADFNFFDKRVQFFVSGQVAFLVLDLEADSGTFFTVVADGVPPVNAPAEGNLTQSRTKSAWQTAAEGGVRYHLKNGLHFEMAYNITGYLDVVINPPLIQIPQSLIEAAQGTSAVFNTQDLVSDGWRVGIGFQF